MSALKNEKILLGLLPFWDPMIPPQGIASLKSFLQVRGYEVKTADANVEEKFKSIYTAYFDTLATYIPADRRLNFYHMGHDVLQNHMMAYIHYENPVQYHELIKILIYRNFFYPVATGLVIELDKLIAVFYERLTGYLLGEIQVEMPSVLGFSGYCGTLPASMFAFRLIREKYPHIKTIFGGGVFADQLAVGSPDLDFFLQTTAGYIDKIIIGAGEELFLKYLQDDLPQSQRVYIAGESGMPPESFFQSVIPDLGDFETRYYPYLGASASRSCPFQCAFCNALKFWGKYRAKDVTQSVDQLTQLHKIYGGRLFFFDDFLLNPIITPLAEELVKCDLPIYWDGYLRVDEAACDIETTLLWRRGGYYRSRLGVESGSQHVLDMMGKNITPALTTRTLAALANAGIKTTTYWVIGYPGETEADFQETLAFVAELKDFIWQAEPSPFKYHYTGQANSDRWAERRTLLYPEEARNLLISQTWVLNGEPSWEEITQRVNRFVRHCAGLGIPNPYSFREIYKADERWKNLHKNAVPPLLELKKNGGDIDERKKIKKIIFAGNSNLDDGQFDF